ncbi:MAG: hypothetical protein ACYSWU_04200 [Planctomycetota bacterium]|jgi:hypothetical protein
MPEIGKDWIVVGSSPSAAEWLPVVRERYPDAVTMTTNRGINLFEDTPDIYYFGDERVLFPETFEEYRETARRLKQEGAHTVGLLRLPEVMTEWDVEWIDDKLTVRIGSWRPWKFVKGKYTAVSLSGLFCLQYAVNQGAEGVHLVGMEGYGDEGHYFDGGRDSQVAKDLQRTTEVIGPFTQALVKACPEVQFTFYGQLNYTVAGANVTLRKDLSKWNSSLHDAGEDSGLEISGISPMARQTC